LMCDNLTYYTVSFADIVICIKTRIKLQKIGPQYILEAMTF